MTSDMAHAREAEREARARQVLSAASLLAEWRDKLRRYHTTGDDCRCPDRQYRRAVCKHMLAWRLLADRKREVRHE